MLLVGHRRLTLDRSDKAEAPFGQRADEALAFAAVADGAARRADTGTQRRLRNDPALPDRIDQLVLADDPVAVADQEEQQVEHLRLDPDGLPAPAQLMPSEIDFKLAESEVQGALPK